MLNLDGTENKKNLGANSLLAVSLAVRKASIILNNENYCSFQFLNSALYEHPFYFSIPYSIDVLLETNNLQEIIDKYKIPDFKLTEFQFNTSVQDLEFFDQTIEKIFYKKSSLKKEIKYYEKDNIIFNLFYIIIIIPRLVY